MGSSAIYPAAGTTGGQETAQSAAIAQPYATVNLIETTAPITANFVYCIATQTTYELVATGTFVVDHVNVLSAVGTSLYVWKAIDGLYGPNIPIFTDSDEPNAANVANLLWWNSTSGTYRYSNGTTKIDLGAGINPSQDDGLTIVCPNYMNVANGTTFQMNATTNQIKVVYPVEVDFASFGASLYLSAIGAAGNITATIYAADSTDAVVGSALGTVTFGSGSSAGAWIRHLWTAIQHQRSTRVAVVYSVANGVDITVYGSRQLPATNSGLCPGMNCYTSTDSGGTWVLFTQDSRSAQFAWILNSSANNAPQAVYGRYRGNRVSLFENGFWQNYYIPQTGVVFNIESGFSASTMYNRYVHSSGGTLVIDGSTTGRVMQDGQEVKSGALGYRFLGLFYGITRNSQVAMIDCHSISSLWNLNGRMKTLFRQPYGTTSSATVTNSPNSWKKWNANDDFTIQLVVGMTSLNSLVSRATYGSQRVGICIGMDDATMPYRGSAIATSHANYNMGFSLPCNIDASEGIHSLYCLEHPQDVASQTVYYYYFPSTDVQGISTLSVYYRG